MDVPSTLYHIGLQVYFCLFVFVFLFVVLLLVGGGWVGVPLLVCLKKNTL